MPLDRPKIPRWLGREWFTVLVLSCAMVLGLAQVWLERAFHPPVLVLVATGAFCVAAWVAFIYVVLRLRQPLHDLKYRWITRGVDRAMRQADHLVKRSRNDERRQ